MSRIRRIEIVDTHSGGDVSRIVLGGIVDLPGKTVREKMLYFQAHADGLRRLLLSEPYGIPEMSVDLVLPPTRPDVLAGYIIMEVMGYPVYSGSNTICTATALLETGRIPLAEGPQEFTLESPAGLARIRAEGCGKRVASVTCEGLPSYIVAHRITVDVDNLGPVTCSIAYSGGFYALVDASDLGFALERSEEAALAATAHAIVVAIRKGFDHRHPVLGDVGALPFLHYMGPVERMDGGPMRSRSATYVHPGVICRSPTGTGTSARLALMHHEGTIEEGDRLETVSLRDTRFVGTFHGVERGEHGEAVKNSITGKGQILARTELVIDLDDPLLDTRDLDAILADPVE